MHGLQSGCHSQSSDGIPVTGLNGFIGGYRYPLGLHLGYIGIMENKMETTS